MEIKSYLRLSDANVLKTIQKDLNEDPERLKNQIHLFEEWLKCETYLPKDVDDNLIVNFIRFSKCNLEKAKRKFENFLATQIKLRLTSSEYRFDEKYFAVCDVHRQLTFHPKLTSEGYRVCFYRLPTIDRFDFDQSLHYGLIMLGVIFLEDTCSGQIIVYDFAQCSPQHIPKINLKSLVTCMNLLYNVSPMRIKNIHILNLPKLAETLFNIVIKTINEKTSKRFVCHKEIKALSKWLSDDIVPEEYGGNGGNLDKHGDQMKEFLLNNEEFAKRISKLKLMGPVPSNKTNLYSFEEYGMDGSFRKLDID